MINIWTIFLTGLFTGGLSCLAVQGGLLAATIAQNEEEKLKSKTAHTSGAVPILAFLGAKLAAYTLLGFLLGWFGSLFQISLAIQVVMQFLVALFMIGTALNILEVHPVFRYFTIQPPRFVAKLLRNQSKSKSIFAPALLGALTVFIPCGTTQAMMALSIGSADPFLGAMILFAFVLGTSPLFFILGYFTTKLSETMHQTFMKLAAITLIVLALFNLINVLALSGIQMGPAPQTLQRAKETPVSEATIEFTQTAYSPQSITVKAGSQVTLNLSNVSGSGCIQAFTIPKLGIQRTVAVGTKDQVQFTAPTQPQQIEFMCSMGMYRGVINVI
ncbi:MAG: hypothetical protein UZ21_OP11001000273 [Microgenomates bacterium OLB22]|nr:MAG: hypothetical protein UZ21_OP11001000273 [Microgenomates bacterium OLB22]